MATVEQIREILAQSGIFNAFQFFVCNEIAAKETLDLKPFDTTKQAYIYIYYSNSTDTMTKADALLNVQINVLFFVPKILREHQTRIIANSLATAIMQINRYITDTVTIERNKDTIFIRNMKRTGNNNSIKDEYDKVVNKNTFGEVSFKTYELCNPCLTAICLDCD